MRQSKLCWKHFLITGLATRWRFPHTTYGFYQTIETGYLDYRWSTLVLQRCSGQTVHTEQMWGKKKPELSLQLLPEESNTCVREVEIRNVRYTTKYINVCAKTTKKKYTHFTTSKGSMRNKSNHKVSFCLLWLLNQKNNIKYKTRKK